MKIGLVNDLPIARAALRRVVEKVPGYTIAWEAHDGREALQLCLANTPDVVLMDLIMPVMDGAESTREIMRRAPCPILVVTASVTVNAAKVYEAMGYGALDAVRTPTLGPDGKFEGAAALLSKIELVALLAGKIQVRDTRSIFPTAFMPPPLAKAANVPPLVAIGASTGGPQALAEILTALPKKFPAAVAIVQHVDSEFAAGLADWLTSHTGHDVTTARAGRRFEPGRIYLAATQDHLVVDAHGNMIYTPLPREVVYRPSVDVFFRSLAQHWPHPGVAVVLTGMGRDGAAGLKVLRDLGWHTIAQGPHTSIVYGMPKAAAEAGAAKEILELPSIGKSLAAHFILHK
jgi:two-component system response regulator WspF